MELETKRLILRDWRESDHELFFRLNSDSEVMEHFPKVLSRQESDESVERMKKHINDHGYGLWAMELKDSGLFVGTTGIFNTNFESHFTPCHEVGWRLDKAHWGKGYAPEAAQASIAFGFNNLNLDEVVAITAVQNKNSRRVMEKLGMIHNPKDDFDHPKVPADSHVLRHVLYKVKKAHWKF